MTDILNILRSRLELLCKEYMDEHDVSEAELARRLGIAPQKLNKLLNLQLRIGFREAETIATFFKVSIAWLCGESELRQRITPEMQTALGQILGLSVK